MKWFFFILLVCISFLLPACKNEYPKAENAFDGGREFIDACLKGDFEKASFYMVDNEENRKDLEEMKDKYSRKSNDEKVQYHDASINILEEDAVSDSVHIINYQNSYDKIARKVKVVQTGEGWLVDFSYTFNGNL